MSATPMHFARRLFSGGQVGEERENSASLGRPYRVLSVDGGGIRGILPAMVLADLEARAEKPAADLFDLIVGTSTGGLLALAVASAGADGRPRHSAADVVRLYEKEGSRVFSRSTWHKIRAVGNLTEGKYPTSGIEGVLEDCFGEARLKDTLCDVVVPAYEIERRAPFLFKSRKARKKPKHDFLVKHALRAATAAPTYFEPAQIHIDERNYYALVDGALFAYNPAMCAYVEAIKRQDKYDSIVMVSLGTGELTRRLPFDDVKDWGAARWAQPVFDLMCDGISDAVDYQVGKLLPDLADGSRQYHRFQVRLEVGNDDMDDASNTNIRMLKLLGEEMLQSRRAELRELAMRLSAWAPQRENQAVLAAPAALGAQGF